MSQEFCLTIPATFSASTLLVNKFSERKLDIGFNIRPQVSIFFDIVESGLQTANISRYNK